MRLPACLYSEPIRLLLRVLSLAGADRGPSVSRTPRRGQGRELPALDEPVEVVSVEEKLAQRSAIRQWDHHARDRSIRLEVAHRPGRHAEVSRCLLKVQKPGGRDRRRLRHRSRHLSTSAAVRSLRLARCRSRTSTERLGSCIARCEEHVSASAVPKRNIPGNHFDSQAKARMSSSAGLWRLPVLVDCLQFPLAIWQEIRNTDTRSTAVSRRTPVCPTVKARASSHGTTFHLVRPDSREHVPCVSSAAHPTQLPALREGGQIEARLLSRDPALDAEVPP